MISEEKWEQAIELTTRYMADFEMHIKQLPEDIRGATTLVTAGMLLSTIRNLTDEQLAFFNVQYSSMLESNLILARANNE